MALPQGCKLVGIELIDDAVDLPSFRHPLRAAYVLGPEHGSLSPELLARCDYVVRIPTDASASTSPWPAPSSCTTAWRASARLPPRPVGEGGPAFVPPKVPHGAPRARRPAPADG